MKKHGFTLIEIMVVVSIIIMLAATLVSAGMFAHKVVMRKVTEGIINNISLALGNYSSDYNGEYPPSHQRVGQDDDCITGMGAGIQSLCSYLFRNTALTAAVPVGKPDFYLKAKDFRNDTVVFNASQDVDYIVDAWGIPMYYYRPGAPSRNPDSYDLFSAGPDQKTATVVWNKDGSSTIHDYRTAAPIEFSAGSVAAATGGTGDAADISAVAVDPANDQDRDDIWDDIHNWKKTKSAK